MTTDATPDRDDRPAGTELPRRLGRGARWRTAGWSVAVCLTILNGVVVGYGVVWFQLFGSTPDVEDYRVSAGGYGAAAAVLALGAVGLAGRRGTPPWLVVLAGVAASVLAVLAAGSVVQSTTADQVGIPVDGPWTGAGGVIWAPWTWALVWLGVDRLWQMIGAPRARRGGPALPRR